MVELIGATLVMVGIVAWIFVRISAQESQIADELAIDFNAERSRATSSSGIAYDPSGPRIKVAVRRPGGIASRIVLPGDVVEVAVFDSGSVVAQTGGGVAGAVVGGVALGAIGGRRSRMSVDVGLHIILDDPDDPSWTLSFVELSDTKSDLADPVRRAALADAREWYGIVAALRPKEPPVLREGGRVAPDLGDDDGPARSDLAAQLHALAEMHKGGLLSKDEFEKAKARLLSS